jgi:drug/metabolite transporter (DMT)-like permease
VNHGAPAIRRARGADPVPRGDGDLGIDLDRDPRPARGGAAELVGDLSLHRGGGRDPRLGALRRDGLWLDARGWAFAVALGFAQFVLNFNFVYRAEQHITSGVVAIVYALLLVPNAILARIFLGQLMGRQLLIGSAVAMAGVALLFLHEARLSDAGPEAALIGIGIALLGVLSASVANVMQATRTAKAYPMATTLGWAMLTGAAIDAAFAWSTVGPPVIETRGAMSRGRSISACSDRRWPSPSISS